jgi:hypothetical protein
VVNTQSVKRFVPKRQESSGDIAYHGRGFKVADSLWDYTWDSLDRLTWVRSSAAVEPECARVRADFTYDSQGRRATKTVFSRDDANHVWAPRSTIKFAYAGWLLLAELDGNNRLLRSYVWGQDSAGSITGGGGGVGGLLAVRVHDPNNGGAVLAT